MEHSGSQRRHRLKIGVARAEPPEWLTDHADLNMHALGPGAELEAEWQAAGLALRRYRLERVREQLRNADCDAALLYDPVNIRYATDTTNMSRRQRAGPVGRVVVGQLAALRRVDRDEAAVVGTKDEPLIPGGQQSAGAGRRADGLRHRPGRRVRHLRGHVPYVVVQGRPANCSPARHWALAAEQIERNIELHQAGMTLREITDKAWYPDPDQYRHYTSISHGVGLCDEYPAVGQGAPEADQL
ncbi:aminopeptidase P family N-terminal domain-containing protein [Candidatus Poriferisodalis sp.]|uniref:aminopeptidase P family N-terminal domain-containing protein n=1 Tax=Candidatus Poriferisodalis sp. TaxID=3101277 RepID=UPI003B51CD42